MEHDDVIIPLKTIGVFRLGSYTPIDAKLYTLADLENAREEERSRCLAEIKYELIDTPADRFDSIHNSAVWDCLFAIETLGPVSSIEDRVRRDVAKDLMPDLLIAEHGLISADASLRGPETRWPPVENGLNSIERVIKKLDAIAEGREG